MARRVRKTSFWNNWRHMAAYVYLTICIFDFMGMPVFYEIVNPRLPASQLIGEVAKLPESQQVQAIQILHEERTWESLTLGQGGLFHMAFGAILGVAAFTRGQEKTWYAKRGQPYGGHDYDYDPNLSEDEYFAPNPPKRLKGKRTKDEPQTPDPFADEES